MNAQEQLRSELNLTDAQQEKMKLRRAEYEKIMSNSEWTDEVKKEKIIEMKMTEDEDILSAEQREMLKRKRAARSADQMLRRDKRKADLVQMQTLRAEFDKQISTEDREMIADLRSKVMQNRKARDGKSSADGENQQANKKLIKSLSLKYEDRVKAFLKENGMVENKKLKSKKSHKVKGDIEKGRRDRSNRNGSLRRDRRGNKVDKFLLMEF